VARYAAEFERADAAAAGQPAWLALARRAAITRFGEVGFPTTKLEAWRFTSVAPIADEAMVPAGPVAAGAVRGVVDETHRRLTGGQASALAVVVNGRYVPELSSVAGLPAGVVVSSLEAAIQAHPEMAAHHLTRVAGPTEHPFVVLNTAFLRDGVFVKIPAKTVLSAPLHLLCLSTGHAEATAVSHPRVLVVAGERSESQIIETYAAAGDRRYFTNAVTEVVTEAEAIVDHYKVQIEAPTAFHLGSLYLHAARASRFSSHSLTLGGQLVRNDVVATLDGEGVECTLNGLYLAGGVAVVDNHTTIDHAMPHCTSHEIYKGILWDRARAVFNGKIVVRPDAQKTDAKQTNKALLLSDEAQINSKPELEIFANDVKCTHGAAIGQLDDEALFYLRARGLTLTQARAMLIHAFAGDIVQRMQAPALRAELEAALAARLPGGAA
jgi:Fe-S cluster assembly protein SufD